MADAYPLQWPDGWKRTPLTQRRRSVYKVTPDRATRQMLHSIKLLGGRSIAVSSNVEVRRDGLPYANQRIPNDGGAAVYWTDKEGHERVMACDRWLYVWENIHAIGLALEGLRAIERAGATQILERAFTAFGALPASPDETPKRKWWDVLEIPEAFISALSLAMVKAKFRELAAALHPDRTGNPDSMVELNAAMAEAEEHFR